MQIGKYKLYSIQTGLFKLDGGAMFGVVPKPLWSMTNPADESNRIEMCMRSLLLVSADRKILIDNGVGYKTSSKFREIYAINHEEFKLENELRKHNISANEITDVIITHLHFDHAGGSTYRDENGELKLTFPNAIHHIQKKQWEWGQNPSDRDKASYIPDNYNLIDEKKMLNLLNGDTKFDDEISLHTVNGHTPGMQLIKISDEIYSLFYAADLLPMTSHIPLPYIMGYDLFPLTTLDEKKYFLPMAAHENWKIFFEHDPFTEVCRIEQTQKGFKAADKGKLSEL